MHTGVDLGRSLVVRILIIRLRNEGRADLPADKAAMSPL